MNHQYQITVFRAEQLQRLRNVKIHSPSMIQIISGSKRLFWKEAPIELSKSGLLLCEASSSLSFENLPHKGQFLSRVFTFHCQPDDAMLIESKSNAGKQTLPMLDADKALQQTLAALYSFERQSMSKATQTFWVKGIYQQLAERGALHHLFPNTNATFSQTLSRYLANCPSQEHKLDVVAARFSVSRATMIRKLKQEGTQYREVLAEVRLSHALHLMQNGQHNVAMLSQLCGYQSESRFSQRFKGRFGITPSEYIKTIGV